MPPFDIDIYSLLPIIVNKCDRQYCLYGSKKNIALGFFRRVSYSTEKHRPSHENSGYLGGADDLIDGE